MNFCNKHQSHFDEEKECMYCAGRNRRGEWAAGDDPKPLWPHATSEQLLLSIPTEGIKHDQAKADLSLLPREALEEMAKAFMHGEKKYGRYNFMGGMDWHRLVASSMRHITAFNAGEDLDAESGAHHLGCALAGISMLLVYYKRSLGTDTRYKGGK